jgi:hypothetical protein
MRVIGQSNELDLATIAMQQEQTIAMFIQHALNPMSQAIVAEPFHTFAAQVGLFSMVKAELFAIENGIPAYERPALYEQVWRDLIDGFAEAKARSCCRRGEHACLGKIVWGEAYGWSAAQLKEAYMEYAMQLEHGVPSVAGSSEHRMRDRTVSSSASGSPDVTFTNTPSASSSMTSPYVSPQQQDPVAAANCDIEAEFNANVKAALQTLYSIEEANAQIEKDVYAAPSTTSASVSTDEETVTSETVAPLSGSLSLERRPTWMNFWDQAQPGTQTSSFPVTSIPLADATQGLNLDLNAALDLSALMAAPLVEPTFGNASVLGAAFVADDTDALRLAVSDLFPSFADSNSEAVDAMTMKRKAIDCPTAADGSTMMQGGRSKRHYTRSKVQRRLLQDVSLRMRALVRQLQAHASDAKLTEAMAFAMSGKTPASQWADMQGFEMSPAPASALLDDNERKRLSKQRLRKRDVETIAKLAGMANIVVETPLGTIKTQLKTVQSSASGMTAAQRRQELINNRNSEQWPLQTTLQAWLEFQDDWDDLIATERRLLPSTVPNGRSIDTMVQLLRLAINTST